MNRTSDWPPDRRRNSMSDPRRDTPPPRRPVDQRNSFTSRNRSRSPPRKVQRRDSDRQTQNSPRRDSSSVQNDTTSRQSLFVSSPTQSTSQAAPSATNSPRTPTTPNTASNELKQILTIVNHAVYWGQEFDKADKRFQKLNAQYQQYQSTKFTSGIGLLRQQTASAKSDRDKAAKRRRAEEDRLSTAVGIYESNFMASTDAKVREAVKNIQPAAPAAPTVTIQDVNKRFEELGEQMAKDIYKKVAENAQVEKKQMQEEFQSRMSELNASLQQERSRTEKLSSDLAAQEAKVTTLCREVDQLSTRLHTSITSEKAATSVNKKRSEEQNAYINTLLSRLGSQEEKLSEVEKTCALLKQEAARAPTSPPHTPNSPDFMSTAMHDQLARLEKVQEDIDLQQSRLSSEIKSNTFEKDQLQQKLDRAIGDFDKILNEEREKQAFIQRAADETKAAWVAKAASMEEHLQRQQTEVAKLGGHVSSVQSSLQSYKEEGKKELAGFSFRLNCLLQWQNNWDTTALYDKIIAHMGATYPQSLSQRTDVLDRRLGNVELFIHQSQQSQLPSPANTSSAQGTPHTQPAPIPAKRTSVTRPAPSGLVAPQVSGSMPAIRTTPLQSPQGYGQLQSPQGYVQSPQGHAPLQSPRGLAPIQASAGRQ